MIERKMTYYDDGPDRLGRRRFCLSWHDGYRCRGQMFHAVPPADVVIVAEEETAPCGPCYRGEPDCEKRGLDKRIL